MPAPPLQSEPAMVRTEGDCAGFSDDIGEQSFGFIDLISYSIWENLMTQGEQEVSKWLGHNNTGCMIENQEQYEHNQINSESVEVYGHAGGNLVTDNPIDDRSWLGYLIVCWGAKKVPY